MKTIMLAVCLLATAAQAQTIRNPRFATFLCSDHALDTGHEIDIVNAAGVVIQTLQGGDPAADATGLVTIPLNVQPVAFGLYTLRVRAMFGELKSDDSVSSDVWERAPSAPGKPVVGG